MSGEIVGAIGGQGGAKASPASSRVKVFRLQLQPLMEFLGRLDGTRLVKVHGFPKAIKINRVAMLPSGEVAVVAESPDFLAVPNGGEIPQAVTRIEDLGPVEAIQPPTSKIVMP